MKNVCFAVICFLGCLNGVLFNTQSEEREKIPFKIGENVTLIASAKDNVVLEVVWAKEVNTFLEISDNNVHFLNESFKSRVCSQNLSSITICNATSEDAGMYRANLKCTNKSSINFFFSKIYYVEEHPDDETEVVKSTDRARTNSTSSDHTAVITGYITGCAVLVALFISITIFVCKKKSKDQNNEKKSSNHAPVPQNDSTPQVIVLSNGSCQQHSCRYSTGYGLVSQVEKNLKVQ
ncbi:uncharacterized protein [Aquarana catesbeiana]|uniref:uncharacterized protein isoform X1 n=1 Tax=Aquarana catesbeiana TaxID=8400 RepID=UPI003CCA6D44